MNEVFNGLINVPDIHVEYQGFTIQPKRDFGGVPYHDAGNVYQRGFIVTKDHMQVMPGGAWFTSVIEARAAIDILLEAGPEQFWEVWRQRSNGEEEDGPRP